MNIVKTLGSSPCGDEVKKGKLIKGMEMIIPTFEKMIIPTFKEMIISSKVGMIIFAKVGMIISSKVGMIISSQSGNDHFLVRELKTHICSFGKLKSLCLQSCTLWCAPDER